MAKSQREIDSAQPRMQYKGQSMHNNVNKDDFGFAIKITIANILTYWLSTIPPMILDPKLAHSPQGVRHYPHSWLVFPIGLALGALTFFVMTRIQKRRRVLYAALSFSLASILSLPLFPPFPDGYVVIVGVLFLVLSTLTVWIHNEPIEDAYASDKTIDRTARMECVKEEIHFWRGAIIGFVVTYLALLVTWFSTLNEASLRASTDPVEQQMLIDYSGSFICITSVWVVFGPLAEAAKKRREAQNVLLKIEV